MKFPTLLEYLTGQRDKLGVLMLAPMLNKLIAEFTMTGIKFYSQPLALWMFIPCSEDGEPIKRPVDNSNNHDEWCAYECLRQEYQAAEQRVLFEGCKLIKQEEKTALIENQDGEAFVLRRGTNINVDGCVGLFHSLRPTQSSINQLNLK